MAAPILHQQPQESQGLEAFNRHYDGVPVGTDSPDVGMDPSEPDFMGWITAVSSNMSEILAAPVSLRVETGSKESRFAAVRVVRSGWRYAQEAKKGLQEIPKRVKVGSAVGAVALVALASLVPTVVAAPENESETQNRSRVIMSYDHADEMMKDPSGPVQISAVEAVPETEVAGSDSFATGFEADQVPASLFRVWVAEQAHPVYDINTEQSNKKQARAALADFMVSGATDDSRMDKIVGPEARALATALHAEYPQGTVLRPQDLENATIVPLPDGKRMLKIEGGVALLGPVPREGFEQQVSEQVIETFPSIEITLAPTGESDLDSEASAWVVEQAVLEGYVPKVGA